MMETKIDDVEARDLASDEEIENFPDELDEVREVESTGVIRGIASTRKVFINKDELDPAPSRRLRNHSPDGFNWGYGGSGPSQLALAIILKLKGEEFALNHYQKFKWDVIASLEQGKDFEIPFIKVVEWCTETELGIKTHE